MKLAIIEANKADGEHSTFNRSVLEQFFLSPEFDCKFYCCRSHFESIGLPFKKFFVPVVSITSRRFFFKYFVEMFSTTLSLVSARICGYKKAIFMSAFPPMLYILPIMSKVFGIKVFVIIHGELEGAVDASRYRFSSFGFWIVNFFKNKGYKYIKCIILGEGIHYRICEIYPEARAYLAWANHPVPVTKIDSAARDILAASVGFATLKKHGELFDHIKIHNNLGIKFFHIGMVEKDVYDIYYKDINFLVYPGGSLSRSDFFEYLARTKNAIFPYADDSYRLAVSGAILDALSCGCNILTLKNRFSEDLKADGFSVEIVPALEDLVLKVSCVEHNIRNSGFLKYSSEAFFNRVRELIYLD